MKPCKLDKNSPVPPGMKKVHISYYMCYPKAAPAAKKAAKNVTVRRKKAKKSTTANSSPSYWTGRS